MAASEGLMCAGLNDEVEKRILSFLLDEKVTISYYSLVSGRLFEGDEPSESDHDVAELLLSRPALRAEVLKHIRLIPERFTPESALRRREQSRKEQKQS